MQPGRYLVLVELPGYLTPLLQFTSKELQSGSTALAEKLKTLPQVVVAPDRTASAQVGLDRGATVSGTVRFDDGGAAETVNVRLLRKEADDKWDVPVLSFSQLSHIAGSTDGWALRSDDQGHFRLIGLPAGDYIVKVSFPSEQISIAGLFSAIDGAGFKMTPGQELNIYSGDTFRRKDAKSFSLKEGMELTGMDVSIRLADLHEIHGTVTARSDDHAIGSGTVELVDPDDKSTVLSAQLSRDGAFLIRNVPSGSYTLRIANANDRVDSGAATRNARTKPYGKAEMAISIPDSGEVFHLSVPE